MQVGDLVTLTDARGEHTGTVEKVSVAGFEKGIVLVKWASGVSERVHEDELTLRGRTLAPRPGDGVYDAEEGFIDPELLREEREADEKSLPSFLEAEDDSGYEPDDPKHPTFRERLSALWDSRSGK